MTCVLGRFWGVRKSDQNLTKKNKFIFFGCRVPY